jgi:hypothetical protein
VTVTRDADRNAGVPVTRLEQNRTERTEQTGVTGLIEVTDEQALAAWDA